MTPTGSISMSQVAAELGVSATGLGLGHSLVRVLAESLSGNVSMSNLRGKAYVVLTSGQYITGGGLFTFKQWGYEASKFGSMSKTTGLVPGGALEALYVAQTNDEPPTLVVRASGSLSQSAFSRVVVSGVATYQTSAASFAATSSISVWSWADVGNPFADAGVQRQIVFAA